MKLSGDPPDYPAVASHAQIQGTVVLAATIGPDGAVQSLEPVSGPALLEAAFIGAARSWRYRPYLIYGHPVAFQTQISITFRLNAPPQ
jgi:protein TonB